MAYPYLALRPIRNELVSQQCWQVARIPCFQTWGVSIAEDNDLNDEIAITLLEDMGLIVERVEDGIQCVAKMEQMPAKSYDLILMDIQMPHMDGYKATQTIRQLSNKDKAMIPIIALTANAFEEDRKKAVAQGMNGHISKPMDVDKIEKVLLSILK